MIRPPILENKDPASSSIFEPNALLREARRQKGLHHDSVPQICVLDPDGDIVRRLRQINESKPFAGWPCYHTQLDTFQLNNVEVGIVGCAVGAPFAVLVAEQLFASGCTLLISITSAGQIAASGRPPYFVIIDQALRDEGTSYHYASPAEFAMADPILVEIAIDALAHHGMTGIVGKSWTTDAPFRETKPAIEAARKKSIITVEMEAAALYSFASATGARVLCIAHVTNSMGQVDNDFEKGESDGTADALALLRAIVPFLVRA